MNSRADEEHFRFLRKCQEIRGLAVTIKQDIAELKREWDYDCTKEIIQYLRE